MRLSRYLAWLLAALLRGSIVVSAVSALWYHSLEVPDIPASQLTNEEFALYHAVFGGFPRARTQRAELAPSLVDAVRGLYLRTFTRTRICGTTVAMELVRPPGGWQAQLRNRFRREIRAVKLEVAHDYADLLGEWARRQTDGHRTRTLEEEAAMLALYRFAGASSGRRMRRLESIHTRAERSLRRPAFDLEIARAALARLSQAGDGRRKGLESHHE